MIVRAAMSGRGWRFRAAPFRAAPSPDARQTPMTRAVWRALRIPIRDETGQIPAPAGACLAAAVSGGTA